MLLADLDPNAGAGLALNDRLSGQILGAGRLRIGSTSSSCGTDLVCIERLVHAGNKIFLDDQMQIQGDTTLCCAKPKEERELTPTGTLWCKVNSREQLMFVNIFMTVFLVNFIEPLP